MSVNQTKRETEFELRSGIIVEFSLTVGEAPRYKQSVSAGVSHKNNSLKYGRIVQLPKELILTISVVGLLELTGLSSGIAFAQSRPPSRSYCEEYARNYARRNSSEGQVLRGAAGGAARGALIGGIFGEAGKGAGAGAAFGAIRGGSRQSSDYNYLFNLAFDDCMQGRTS